MADLSTLSNEKLYELADKYYDGEMTLDNLIIEFGIERIKKKRFFQDYLPPIETEYTCEYCGNRISFVFPAKYNAKINHGARNVKEAYVCKNCGHKPFLNDCRCKCCINKKLEESKMEMERKRREDEIKKEIIEKEFPEPLSEQCIKFNDICDTETKVIIAALIKEAADESLSYINSYNTVFSRTSYDTNLFTPSLEWDKKIFKEVVPEYFDVSGKSNISAFLFNDDNLEIISYNCLEVKWYPRIYEIVISKSLAVILDRNTFNFKYEADEIFILWKKIILEELVQNYIVEMKQTGFHYIPLGKKTIERLETLLEIFPLSKLITILYHTTASALKSTKTGNISNRHAANSVIGRTEAYVRKAINEDWDIRDSWRKRECPQSVLSSFFFNYVIPIGDEAIRTVPSKKTIESIYDDSINIEK